MARDGTQVETELKIQLDAEQEARLRRAVAGLDGREGAPKTRELVSIYCDTPGFDLAAAGIALRLRKDGRRWLQTIKRRPAGTIRGLFAAAELERPAPGGRLRLDAAEATGLEEAVLAAADGAAVAPVFETRVRRTVARVRGPRGLVEIAIDRGEVIAGALSAPIREAELELLEGEVGAVFDAARALFREGPIRFAAEPKSGRGLRLAREGRAAPEPEPRKAGDLAYAAGASVEEAAREVLRDCFAQIADNVVVTCLGDDPEGPHQLRVGLRRLRTAVSAFARAMGTDAFGPLAGEAKRLGQVVGALRDLDVLLGELLPAAAARGLPEPARAALAKAIAERRQAVLAEVRAALHDGATVRFLLDLAECIEGRGWLSPADYSQTARLAAPFAEAARGLLDKRHRKVAKLGRHVDDLDAEELHTLRKQLKKLRYTIELCAPLHEAKAAKDFLKAVKALQEGFGTINDAATAGELLAPGGAAPDWGAGWVAGALAVEAAAARAKLADEWRAFEKKAPFWR